MSEFAHPEVLVSTDWVKEHLGQPRVKLIEVDVDTQAYNAGHIPGAVGFNWQTQLQDSVRRDILGKEELEALLSSAGVSPEDTIVLYGDNSNWFAAYAFWLLKLYGHADVRLMDGGRAKWLDEDDKPMTPETPDISPTAYRASGEHPELRAKLADIVRIIERDDHNLVDVRSPDEFSGKVIAPPGMSETAQRAGHIPGAANVPWSAAVNPDGTFKSREELERLYLGDERLDKNKPTVSYCRIGERSSHTWFVLSYLLGLEHVRNYDGSWTEYGNLIGMPIER